MVCCRVFADANGFNFTLSWSAIVCCCDVNCWCWIVCLSIYCITWCMLFVVCTCLLQNLCVACYELTLQDCDWFGVGLCCCRDIVWLMDNCRTTVCKIDVLMINAGWYVDMLSYALSCFCAILICNDLMLWALMLWLMH